MNATPRPHTAEELEICRPIAEKFERLSHAADSHDDHAYDAIAKELEPIQRAVYFSRTGFSGPAAALPQLYLSDLLQPNIVTTDSGHQALFGHWEDLSDWVAAIRAI